MRQTNGNVRLRGLPSIGRMTESTAIREALTRLPRSLVVDSLRHEIGAIRSERNGSTPTEDEIAGRAIARAESLNRQSLARAINATGVVLHTGLGRAVLAEAACEAVIDAASHHSCLEIDLETGHRGSRQRHVRGLLSELTGAESGLVVNNNAGATFLAVNALAAGREVIISRGELVEIGGAFRMPDIIRASGATLVEVGTTNRTRLSDFMSAITANTGLILRCHPSNFRIMGFTEAVASEDLVQLGRKHDITVMDDLGSGAILDTAALGAGPTTTLRAAVESGCDVVTASGDKLLGGPQAGILLGSATAIERIAAHPLARALRVDKMTLAALEATLRLYRDPDRARQEIPTLRYLSRTKDELAAMARSLAAEIKHSCMDAYGIDLVDEQSQVGGGSLPGEDLPTVCVQIRSMSGDAIDAVAVRLRRNRPPIFGRIKDDALLLDPRTLEPTDMPDIAKALQKTLDTQMTQMNADEISA